MVTGMIVMPALASAQSVGDVQSQIQALMNQLRQLQAQLIQLKGGATTTMMWHGDSDASSTGAMMGGDHEVMGGGNCPKIARALALPDGTANAASHLHSQSAPTTAAEPRQVLSHSGTAHAHRPLRWADS